VTTRPPKRLV